MLVVRQLPFLSASYVSSFINNSAAAVGRTLDVKTCMGIKISSIRLTESWHDNQTPE